MSDVAAQTGPDALVVALERLLVRLVDWRHRPIEPAVGEADRVVDHQPLDDLRILRRQTRRQHAAHRVADHHRPFDLFLLQDQDGVSRLRVEVVGRDRLRGSTVADLVGDDDAEACLREAIDQRREIEAAEVVAVQQHDGVAVGDPLRRDVHIGDADVLRVDPNVEVLARVRVRTLVAGDAARLDVSGRGRGWQHACLRVQPGRRLDQQQRERERTEPWTACSHVPAFRRKGTRPVPPGSAATARGSCRRGARARRRSWRRSPPQSCRAPCDRCR